MAKRMPLNKRSQMSGDFMTCVAMFGNGATIGTGAIITAKARETIRKGRIGVLTVFIAAEAGSTAHVAVGLLIVNTPPRRTRTVLLASVLPDRFNSLQ